jgi:hypothetical protein
VLTRLGEWRTRAQPRNTGLVPLTTLVYLPQVVHVGASQAAGLADCQTLGNESMAGLLMGMTLQCHSHAADRCCIPSAMHAGCACTLTDNTYRTVYAAAVIPVMQT